MSRSRPHRTENQEIDHPAQGGADEDLAKLMTIQASSAQLSTEEIKHFEEAQRTRWRATRDVQPERRAVADRKKFRISPQGILYRVEGDRWMMVVPKVLQQKIIRENHDVLAIGHVGLNRTMDHIKRAFWWRGMWSTMGEYVRSCPVCQLVKSDHRKKAGVLQPIPLPREEMAANHYRPGYRFARV